MQGYSPILHDFQHHSLGVPIECLVASGESDTNIRKGLFDGRANTLVIGIDWKLMHQTKFSDFIQGISDKIQRSIPFVIVVIVVAF